MRLQNGLKDCVTIVQRFMNAVVVMQSMVLADREATRTEKMLDAYLGRVFSFDDYEPRKTPKLAMIAGRLRKLRYKQVERVDADIKP